MANCRFWIVGCFTLAYAATAAVAVQAADASAKDAKDEKAAQIAAARDVAAMAATIDKRITAGWEKAKAKPAEPADDAEFLRRVTLDLCGRIPSVSEVRAFLKDTAPDKRARVVEKLLDGPLYVRHFTNYWRQLLMPE